jgi:hypothetical protein
MPFGFGSKKEEKELPFNTHLTNDDDETGPN